MNAQATEAQKLNRCDTKVPPPLVKLCLVPKSTECYRDVNLILFRSNSATITGSCGRPAIRCISRAAFKSRQTKLSLITSPN